MLNSAALLSVLLYVGDPEIYFVLFLLHARGTFSTFINANQNR
jgi:hypothetical protein